MSPGSTRFKIFCFPTLCLCAPLLAQNRGYHMELSDRISGWVILVNDSENPIEAFHISARCGLSVKNKQRIH
jgi:hypothetical protein